MTSQPIVECVPNYSEGNDVEKVFAIIRAMQVENVRLLDYSLDRDHNRSVVTIAGSPDAVIEAAVRGAGKAAEVINLALQNGVHPRIGAADVIPFVPVSSVSLAQCAVFARQAGLQIWRRYGVPIYFYGAAATRPDRVELEEIRRGQFEGLRESSVKDAARRPDIGGPELHPSAGAIAVGARNFLIAYNVYLGPSLGHGLEPASLSRNIGAARAIAREIRDSSGGLRGVKAIGVIANGAAQVSMNITDFRLTSVQSVFDRIRTLATRYGVAVAAGELIGLIPEEALRTGATWTTEIPNFDPDLKVLERRLVRPMAWPPGYLQA